MQYCWKVIEMTFKVIHRTFGNGLRIAREHLFPLCRSQYYGNNITSSKLKVTCKKCLKIISTHLK